MMTPLEEACHWAERAEANRSKADCYKGDKLCRRTLLAMAEQADAWSQRALTHAIAFDAALHEIHNKEPEMLSKSGLHPYRAALFFILRESEKAGPRSRAAVVSGDIAEVSKRQTVRMLAAMFDKSGRAVARDLIDTYRAIEDGEAAP
jgi:hypothetical protein